MRRRTRVDCLVTSGAMLKRLESPSPKVGRLSEASIASPQSLRRVAVGWPNG